MKVNGLELKVRDSGSGTPVILLHGFPDTGELWRHQVRALNGAGFRTIVPDMRGRGDSDKPAEVAEYALTTIVRDVVGILDELGIDKAHVVGHDWGAAVAWLVAILAPQRVDHLVAISVGCPGTAGRPGLEELQKAWYRILIQIEGVAEELFQQDDWYLMRTLMRGDGDTEANIRRLGEPGALTAGLNWYRANLPVSRLLAEGGLGLPPVQASTMGIWSTDDAYLTEAAMKASATKVTGGWRYEQIEGVGHFIPVDAPDRLNELLLDFLH